MKYELTNAVWEITYACNMRCKHCGSSCGSKYPDELDTSEALNLCDDLASLGLKVVTLSGGEPFLRKDWDLIAKRLQEKGVIVNAISNGWYIDETLIDKALDAGIVNIGISMDGFGDSHDYIRTKGSFERILNALDVMNSKNMSIVICTSVHKKNLPELPRMYEILKEKNVGRWQFQIASPMGNLLDHRDWIIDPTQIDDLIDFAHKAALEGKVYIDLADNIGYYNTKLTEISSINSGKKDSLSIWAGCKAGKRVIGIRANGDISACLSIRDPKFIEGNIRDEPLPDMWTREDAFSWNRNLKKSDLTGFCGKCQYGRYCLGGCTGAKNTLAGNLYDNTYCSFRLEIEKEIEKASKITDVLQLIEMAKNSIEEEGYQWAEVYLSRALDLNPGNIDICNLLGLSHFFLQNYEESKKYSMKVLEIDPMNSYAHKGLGLVLFELGKTDESIMNLEKAIELSDDTFLDPYYDYAIVLSRLGKTDKAIDILDRGRAISESFVQISKPLYNSLVKKAQGVTAG